MKTRFVGENKSTIHLKGHWNFKHVDKLHHQLAPQTIKFLFINPANNGLFIEWYLVLDTGYY